MRKLSTGKRATILSALVEGNSINATARMCSVSKITVLRLLADAGQLCADYHDVYVRGLASKRVQADEIWAFCGCKDKAKKAGANGHREAHCDDPASPYWRSGYNLALVAPDSCEASPRTASSTGSDHWWPPPSSFPSAF